MQGNRGIPQPAQLAGEDMPRKSLARLARSAMRRKEAAPKGRSTRLTRRERMERKHGCPRPIRPHDAGPLAALRPFVRRKPGAECGRQAGQAEQRRHGAAASGMEARRGETRAARLDAARQPRPGAQRRETPKTTDYGSTTRTRCRPTPACGDIGEPLRERMRRYAPTQTEATRMSYRHEQSPLPQTGERGAAERFSRLSYGVGTCTV